MTADAVGGVWFYALRLASLLTARGIEVCVATMGPEPSAEQRKAAARIPRLELRTSAFALEWMPAPWEQVDRAGDWLLSLAAEIAPDIVHINGFAHAALPWSVPVVLVAHSCVGSWWRAVHGQPPPPEWHEYITRVRCGLRRADAIVAPSRAMRNALVQCYGLGARAEVIPNCVPHDPGLPAGAEVEKEPLVFAVGRVWDRAKNLEMLDRVAADLGWPVVIAGNASPPEGHPAPLPDHAQALGVLSPPEVAAWMSRAAIYVHPARYEPFGLSVLEAASAGCALVLGDIESLRENWAGAAVFVDPGRDDHLRAVLAELMGDSPRRSALGRAARARAARFGPARHVEAYLTLYGKAVTLHGGSSHQARTH